MLSKIIARRILKSKLPKIETSAIEKVSDMLLAKSWIPIAYSFGDGKAMIELEFHDPKEILTYRNDFKTRTAMLEIKGNPVRIPLDNKLFYFFSEVVSNFEKSQLEADNHHYLNDFSNRTIAMRFLDETQTPKFEIVNQTMFEPLPIRTSLQSFGWNMVKLEHIHNNLDVLELMLQFDAKFPAWLYSILSIFKNHPNEDVAIRAMEIAEINKIDHAPVLSEIMGLFGSLMEDVAPMVEAAIINQMKASSSLSNEPVEIEGVTEPQNEVPALPHLDELSDFYKLVKTYINSGAYLPRFHDDLVFTFKSIYEGLQGLISREDYDESALIMAQTLSELLNLQHTVMSKGRHLSLEKDMVMLQVAVQEGTPEHKALGRLIPMIKNQSYIYDSFSLEQLETNVKALVVDIRQNMPIRDALLQSALSRVESLLTSINKEQITPALAKNLSELLLIEDTINSKEDLIEVEADYILLQLYATEGKVDPDAFYAIKDIIDRQDHLYSASTFVDLQSLIKKAYETLGTFAKQNIKGAVKQALGHGFTKLIEKLPDYDKFKDLNSLFDTYSESVTKSDFSKAFRKILFVIHTDYVPAEYQTEDYNQFLRTFIKDFQSRMLEFKAQSS